jgi:hypothetical protein
MANIAAFHALQSLVNQDYVARFNKAVGIEGGTIPKIGGWIPYQRDPVGHYSPLAYKTSMTPAQKQKTVVISIWVVSTLGATVAVIAAIVLRNDLLYFGLIPTGCGMIGGLSVTFYQFSQIDLDSPKVRQKETEAIRTHRFTLSEINKRYGNFSRVVGYALMSNAPSATYEEAARLACKQREADEVYRSCATTIKATYESAIGPARAALERARTAQSLAALTTAQAPRGHKAVPVATTFMASYEVHQASQQYENTVAQVAGVYNQAMQSLNDAYRAVTEPLELNFRQLPLSP